MRNSPPTFTEITKPLDVDDWIHTIKDLLALFNCNEDHEKVFYASHCLGGTARAWCAGIKVMHDDYVITSADFKEGFRMAHIPSQLMAIKKREFRALKQGSGSIKEYMQNFHLLSRYAPKDVSIEAPKIQRMMEGLQQALQYQLVFCDCRTFFELVNKALILEEKRHAMEDTRNSKMISKGSSSNQKPHPWKIAPRKQNFQLQHARTPTPRPSYQPEQYAHPRSAYNNPNNNIGAKTNNFGQVTCFGSGQPRHMSKQCPKKELDAPRTNAPNKRQGRGEKPMDQDPCNQPNNGKGRVNHVTAEGSQEDPDVILGTFLVN